jgi:hypothetical protein
MEGNNTTVDDATPTMHIKERRKTAFLREGSQNSEE